MTSGLPNNITIDTGLQTSQFLPDLQIMKRLKILIFILTLIISNINQSFHNTRFPFSFEFSLDWNQLVGGLPVAGFTKERWFLWDAILDRLCS